MKTRDDDLKKKLCDSGMDAKRADFFCKSIEEDAKNYQTTAEEKEWALARGFYPGKMKEYKLNENNYRDYLSDRDYLMLHPLNNHFGIWINDKLTLKYMLSNKEVFGDIMPEYYLYIENDGEYTYLMDAPNTISKNEHFLLELLKQKKRLALKPNNGTLSVGFMKLEYREGALYKNDKMLNPDEFKCMLNQLNGYIVTEYIHQHANLAAIYSGGGECTLRITMFRNKRETKYSSKMYCCMHSYARFAPLRSWSNYNVDSGDFLMGFNYETGEFDERFVDDRVFLKDGTSLKGKKLPNYECVKHCIEKVCRYLSSLDYFGFDLIISDQGVKLLEINSLPILLQDFFGPLLVKDPTKSFFELKKKEKGLI